MIDMIKYWIEKIKSSAIVKPLVVSKKWIQDNVIKRKLVIFSVLFTAWMSLLLGAIYSPQRQTYTDEQLKTKRTFENGTGEIRLSSQSYSPETGIIVLQFETKDSPSPRSFLAASRLAFSSSLIIASSVFKSSRIDS